MLNQTDRQQINVTNYILKDVIYLLSSKFKGYISSSGGNIYINVVEYRESDCIKDYTNKVKNKGLKNDKV